MDINLRKKVNLKVKPKPFLKWVGGKRQLLEELKRYSPKEFNTYYEPMVGGGALFFELQPKKAVLNDYNKDLVNVYRVIRDNVEDLIGVLDYYEKNNSKEFYYKTRDEFNNLKKTDGNKLELAAKLIYMNKTCFNGLYRVNKKGEFNVPYGRYKSPNICNQFILNIASETLENTEILSKDFELVLKKANKNDFVYIDPPYDPISKTSDFTGYTDNGFGKKEQERLANNLIELDKKGVNFMLSNSDTDFINNLYKGFNIHVVKAKRFINCKSNSRGNVNELIITNY
jgi:DNA adenine methylase